MKTKVKKDNVIKEIDDESLLALYVGAGWKVIENKEKKVNNETENKFNFSRKEI